MTQTEALIALNMVSDIGSVRLGRLLDLFCSPEEIIGAPFDKIRLAGISEKISHQISHFDCSQLTKEMELIRKYKLSIITINDPQYPVGLKNIPGAPIVLYVSGMLLSEDALAIGVVGSRDASFYGLSSAEKISMQLAAQRFTIVSGLARGIDTYAHRGAMKAGGRTIAVMGSGFGVIYPAQNLELAGQISKYGAVISEFPINTTPMPYNFPRRNRIISGLSLGVLVVEAARNSGALITADFALEQGREVFALPGKVGAQNSYGTNELIKQGAKLVTDASDIIEEFMPAGGSSKGVYSGQQPLADSLLAENEYLLYNLISSDKPVLFDELLYEAKMNASEALALLLGLQIKKKVRQLPGKYFIRN